jgi:hypothetical protein
MHRKTAIGKFHGCFVVPAAIRLPVAMRSGEISGSTQSV